MHLAVRAQPCPFRRLAFEEMASSDHSVAHLDADAFYVSIELRRRPELRGLPVVVAGSGPRAVVTTASYEAREYGVGSAMPAARGAAIVPPSHRPSARFHDVSRGFAPVMDIVRAHVERVEVVGLDEAYLDLSGLFSPRAAMRRLIAEIKAETELLLGGNRPEQARREGRLRRGEARWFRGAHARAGVRALRAAPPGLVPGIGPKTAARLAELGLTTLGALGAAPERVLVERFGPNLGVELGRRARFEHDGAVGAARKVVSESRERTFDYDVADPAQLREALRMMAEGLCASLVAHGRSGRTIGIKIRLDDFTTATRARTFAAPTNDVERVTAVALRLLAEYARSAPVRLLGVRIAGLAGDARGARAGSRADGTVEEAGAGAGTGTGAGAAETRTKRWINCRCGYRIERCRWRAWEMSTSATSATGPVRRC